MGCMSKNFGKAFVFGDNITTDALAPGTYMKVPLAELAAHCLESIDTDFARDVKRGDIVIGGDNFGMGSSREQAVMALRELGIGFVVAKSFAGLFFRNCINLGLAPLVCAEAPKIEAGDELCCDASAGTIENKTKNERYACEPIPPHLMAMLSDGGLLPHLMKRRDSMAARAI
jgi:3-isopropylmalate/(R)-2-methylmalate dehydratase small subunit